jgi:OFA family oxalate/formate antiporter-like MFS transporter
MSDRFGRENSMGAAFALAAVAIAALWVLPQNEATVSLVYCVASFAAGAAAVLFPVACADRFGNRFAGTNYGLLHTAKGFGLLLSNLLLAVSALALTDWTVIAAVAVLNLIGAIVALVVLKPLANRHPSGLVGR